MLTCWLACGLSNPPEKSIITIVYELKELTIFASQFPTIKTRRYSQFQQNSLLLVPRNVFSQHPSRCDVFTNERIILLVFNLPSSSHLPQWNGKTYEHTYMMFKTSQELRMLSRSLYDCKSQTLNVMIQVSQFVSSSQLCQWVKNLPNRPHSEFKSKSLSL